jgi:hypothetical protein
VGVLDEPDALYVLPDDEFTSARDALATHLRGDERRDEADEVKALRRPSEAEAERRRTEARREVKTRQSNV